MTLLATVRAWSVATRPVHPETLAAWARRWAELPESARTLARTLGQHAVKRWSGRMLRRTGVAPWLRHRVRPVTFVMHSFMDAADVAPAWEAMQHGEDNTDPRIAATQQRLQACSYAMAHPKTGQLVPVSARASGL